MSGARLSSLHLLALTLLTTHALASPGFDCSKIVDDKITWDLSSLKGPHVLHWQHTPNEAQTKDYTLTLDICAPLKRDKEAAKDEVCPTGTRICAVERTTDEVTNSTVVNPIAIAGDLQGSHGRPLDSVPTRLKYSESTGDTEKEGVRVQLSGGKNDEYDQKAIIEFVCDKFKTGLEGLEGDKEEKEEGSSRRGRLSRRDDEKDDKDNKASLKFISYKEEAVKSDVWGVLRLEWRTMYACESVPSSGSPSGGSWGFFTWFIIITFLGISAYLIFGSWLNYNRYGARGWDLVPHGDAIRDVPYLMKDWGRRVVGAVQGGGSGSRGGYSAVSI